MAVINIVLKDYLNSVYFIILAFFSILKFKIGQQSFYAIYLVCGLSSIALNIYCLYDFKERCRLLFKYAIVQGQLSYEDQNIHNSIVKGYIVGFALALLVNITTLTVCSRYLKRNRKIE